MSDTSQKQALLLDAFLDRESGILETHFLEDPLAVKGVFKHLAHSALLQSAFLMRLHPEDLSRLIAGDVLHEEAMVYLFQAIDFPLMKMVDCLRALPYGSRQFILRGLRANEFVLLEDIERRLDVNYNMIDGVLIEDVSKTGQNKHIIKEIETLFYKDGFLDYFQQTTDAGFRFFEREYSALCKDLLEASPDLLNESSGILRDKSDFSKVLKFTYAFTVDPSVASAFSSAIESAVRRIYATLLAYKEPDYVIRIMEQLPEQILLTILQQCIKDTSQGSLDHINKMNRLVKAIEKAASQGKADKIRKTNRRYELGLGISF